MHHVFPSNEGTVAFRAMTSGIVSSVTTMRRASCRCSACMAAPAPRTITWSPLKPWPLPAAVSYSMTNSAAATPPPQPS